jgi:hypothetical protein
MGGHFTEPYSNLSQRERVAQIRPGSATRSTGLTIRDGAGIDVIDGDQVRVTIRMFNVNARPHGP